MIKTLKTPDKIFLPGDIDWPSAAILTLGNQPGDVEYIRKDTLLEWAKNLKERWEEPPMSRHSPGCVYMLEQLIDKIETL